MLAGDLRALASESTGGRSRGACRDNNATQPEIAPGHWKLQLAAPIPSTGTFLQGCDVYLYAGGRLMGIGAMYSMSHRSLCHINGRWEYDPQRKILSVRLAIDGMSPPQLNTLRITGGTDGRYHLVSEAGLSFRMTRARP